MKGVNDMNRTTQDKRRRFYTVDEFWELVDRTITRTQIYRLVNQNVIPAKRIGKRILIDGTWVNEFLNGPCYSETL